MRDGAKAFFLDLDGTLLAPGAARPADIDTDAIARARRQGHYVFLNSGRSYAFLPEFVMRGDIALDGLACGNGSYLVRDGQVFFSVRVPDEALEAIAPIYDGSGSWCVFEGERENFTMRYERKGGIEIASVGELLTAYAPSRVTKLTAGGVASPQARAVLERWFWICQLDTYYEAVLKGCSKASGIDRMIAPLGVPLENTVAVGDSENDADMLRHAGIGVAMGNATPAAVAAADTTTADCFHGGVAETIRRYTE